MRLLKLLVLLPLFLSTNALADTIIPSQYIIYKNGGQSLPTQAISGWTEPANAYTAITIPFPFDRISIASIADAQVQVVMKANSPNYNTGTAILVCPAEPHAAIGLIGCDMLAFFAMNNAGNAPYTPGCSNNPGGPTPCRADVTTAIQMIINTANADIPLYLTVATWGNGSNGPSLWDAELLINWQLP